MATKAEHVKAIKVKHPSLTRRVNGVTEAVSASEYNATIEQMVS